MTIVFEADSDFFSILLTDYLREMASPIRGENQKQRDMESRYRDGLREGVASGLASYATLARIEMFKPLMEADPEPNRWVAGVYPHDVAIWLNKLVKDWNEGQWSDKTDEALWQYVRESFRSQVIGADNFDDILFGYRKRLILAGHLTPEKSDAKWLQEELEAAQAVMAPLKQLYEKTK